MPLLEVKDLGVRYDKAQILSGVSLAVNDGELVGIVGPNGAGKSTLLRAISGLVRFEARMKRGAGGDIVLAGEVRFGAERIDGLPAHEIRRLGLVPRIREELFAAIRRIHGGGTAVLLVEQEVGQVFRMADRSYVLSQGRIIAQGSARSLMADETLRAGYLGL